MRVTDENLIVLEVREMNVLMLESTITLPYLWGRTVGKGAKTEPSKPPLHNRRSSCGVQVGGIGLGTGARNT